MVTKILINSFRLSWKVEECEALTAGASAASIAGAAALAAAAVAAAGKGLAEHGA